MSKISFPFNPMGAYAKIYHNLAKKYNVPAEQIKLLMNGVYGRTNI